MMAGMTIEKDQLGKEPVTTALGIGEQIHHLGYGKRLPDGPNLHAVPKALALYPIRIDLEVRRLDRRERLELERQPRVPCSHDAMRYESIGVPEMARQAEPRPLCGIVRGEQA